MGFLLFLLAWLVCGFAAVFVMGVMERFGRRFDDDATLPCFFAGPITLLMMLGLGACQVIGYYLSPVINLVRNIGSGE